MTDTSVNDLLVGRSGPPAFKFETIGTTAKGKITNLGQSQVRDFKTGTARTYPDGNPIMQIVITLEQEDGEETRVFVKPDAKRAIREAVERVAAPGLEIGGQLALKYAKDEASQPGMNAKKIFEAQYKAPAVLAPAASGTDLFE